MLKQIKKQLWFGVSLIGFSSAALAHPGHGIESAAAGFMHTITGWDHLLMMLSIGLVAAKSSVTARLSMPFTFLGLMALGIVLGSAGYTISGVETAVAASVMAMGVLLLVSLPISATLRLALVALFGLFHGMAHGVEMAVQYQTLVGILAASTLLQGLGFLLGTIRFKHQVHVQKSIALCMLALGGYALL